MSAADNGGGGGDTGEIKHGGKDFVIEACREASRNRCARPDCRYAHPPPNVKVTDGKVQCCVDFLMGRCYRMESMCRFYHPPPHLAAKVIPAEDPKFGSFQTNADTLSSVTNAILSAQEALSALASVPSLGEKVFEVCQDYMRGMCIYPGSCRYLHPSDIEAMDEQTLAHIICKDFLKGDCNRSACRFYHPPSEYGAELWYSSATAARALASAAAAYGSSSGNPGQSWNQQCKDYLNGKCFRQNCKFYHPSGGNQSGGRRPTRTGDSSKDPCKDYLNGVCFRSSCKFYHPADISMYGDLMGSDYVDFEGAGGKKRSSETCKDFLNGKCNRPRCRFYHPPNSGQIDFRSTKKSSFSGTTGRVGVDFPADTCKDFLNGKCFRQNCKFYHPTDLSQADAQKGRKRPFSDALGDDYEVAGKRAFQQF